MGLAVSEGANGRSSVNEPYLTKAELAEELRVSVRTIERLKLPFTRVGNQNRYLRSQVDQVLAGVELSDNVVPLRPRRKEVAA